MPPGRDTQILEHLVINFPEQLHTDFINFKSLRVLTEANALQPCAYFAHAESCSSSPFASFRTGVSCLSEPVGHGREQIAGLGAFALTAPEAGEVEGNAQLPELGALPPRYRAVVMFNLPLLVDRSVIAPSLPTPRWRPIMV